MSGLAAGLGALGFWLFIAAIIVAGIWNDTKRKESQQETLRRIVESGEDIDPEVIDRLIGKSDAVKTARDLQVAGLITLSTGVGLGIFGVFIGMIDAGARYAMFGVSLMVMCIGAGLLIASRQVGRRYADQ